MLPILRLFSGSRSLLSRRKHSHQISATHTVSRGTRQEYAAKTIKEIYDKFENLQIFPGMGSDLSKRVSFRTDYKYAIWEEYVIIYKVGNEYVEIYRVVNRYQDITRIFD